MIMAPYLKKMCHNSSRILGVYSNVSIEDIKANGVKTKSFLNVGKEVTFSYDFNPLLFLIQEIKELIVWAQGRLFKTVDSVVALLKSETHRQEFITVVTNETLKCQKLNLFIHFLMC